MALTLNGSTGIVVADGATIGSTSDTDAITVPANGRITFNQAILAQAGIQPNANAYSATEVFDDYEEGTWTPTVTVAGSGMSFDVQLGTYVKSGGLVRAQFYLNATGGTMAGQGLKFGTLPFTPIASHYSVGFGYNNSSNSSIGHPILIVFPSDTNIWYYEQGGNGVSQVTGSTLGNNLSQLWTLFYQTAA